MFDNCEHGAFSISRASMRRSKPSTTLGKDSIIFSYCYRNNCKIILLFSRLLAIFAPYVPQGHTDILRKCFSLPSLEIWTISIIQWVSRKHSAFSRIVDGGPLLIVLHIGNRCGVRLFLHCIACPERPTEVTKTAPHFLCIYTIRGAGWKDSRNTYSNEKTSILTRASPHCCSGRTFLFKL